MALNKTLFFPPELDSVQVNLFLELIHLTVL